MVAVASNLKLITPKEAAEKLRLSLRRVHQFLAEGRIGQRVGWGYVITDDDLRAFQKQPRDPGRPSKKRAG